MADATGSDGGNSAGANGAGSQAGAQGGGDAAKQQQAQAPQGGAGTILSSSQASTNKSEAQGGGEASAPAFTIYEKDGTLNKAFLEAFPEESRAAFSKVASRWKDAANLAKGMENLNWAASQKGFERPPEDAPQNVKDAFNARMRTLRGVPETPDGYELKAPAELPSGTSWDDATAKDFAAFAHKEGFGKEEVQKLTEYQMSLESKRMEAYMKQQDAALTEAFGTKRAEALKNASAAASALGVDVNDPSIGNNASVIKLLAKVHEKLGESSFVAANGPADGGGSVNLQAKALELGKQAMQAQAAGDFAKYNELNRQQSDIARKLASLAKK